MKNRTNTAVKDTALLDRVQLAASQADKKVVSRSEVVHRALVAYLETLEKGAKRKGGEA